MIVIYNILTKELLLRIQFKRENLEKDKINIKHPKKINYLTISFMNTIIIHRQIVKLIKMIMLDFQLTLNLQDVM